MYLDTKTETGLTGSGNSHRGQKHKYLQGEYNMSRRRKKIQSPSNFMGNISTTPPQTNGDMSQAEFIKMMETIGKKKVYARRSAGGKDVMITFNPLKSGTPRFTFRIYNKPQNVELQAGDRAVLYPLFDETRRRIYFMKNENGQTLSDHDGRGTLIIQVQCKDAFAYFIEQYERGIKHTEADWCFDNNVKLPYVEV